MKTTTLLAIALFTVTAAAFTSPNYCHRTRGDVTTLKFDTAEGHPPAPMIVEQKTPVRRSFLHRLDRFLTELQGTTKHLEKHAFLRGNFAPVSEEHVALPVEIAEGELPLGLDGAFLRNGPNPIRAIQRKRYHWFDGHAMLHTLMIKDGKATYTNQVKGQRGTTRLGFNADTIPTALPFQFIPSPRYNIELRLGEEFFPTIGEYKGVESLFICNSLMQRHCASCSFPRLAWADETIIPSSLGQAENQGLEASRPPQYKSNLPLECRMSEDGRLDLVGYETFNDVLDYPVSAHPIQDGDELVFHSYTVDQKLIEDHGTMKLGRYNSQKDQVETYFVPTPSKSYVSFAHSIISTDNYIIVWDCSVHFKTDALFTGGSFFKSNRYFTLKFGVVPKNKDNVQIDDVLWIDSREVGAIVHPLHAWEEHVNEYDDNGGVVSSNVTLKLWTPFCEDLRLELDQSNTFHMVEFAIDTAARKVSKSIIDESINSEFACMPPPTRRPRQAVTPPSTYVPSRGYTRVNARNASTREFVSSLSSDKRFGFTAIFGEDNDGFRGYAKWDLVKRRLDNGELGGEPMLVRSGEYGDERIYVGSYLYNQDEDKSYFALYDGETGGQVCRLAMRQRVPFGFHGQYIDGEDLRAHFKYHEASDSGFNASCPAKWLRFFLRDYILGSGSENR
ncbi:hypothetical protein THAOC_26260 [Thalassiosira oceanica]|uniref:Dioxygenase n=1 Tax=Thalassiosira oceanica TaxID=159749 RepID=K0RZI4_THAOC|nr:hypothetical protein THAOC_26260 [Thalassiosira oceanica]|eukprot:EJK54176.1 hypothetical protein THAOC_26260 [Thalassiosira oceanica]